jgi:hypothetical protein
MKKIIEKYKKIDNEKNENLNFIEYISKENLDELIFYLENNNENFFIFDEIILIIIMKITTESYCTYEEENKYNYFSFLGEMSNINGIDRLINIFNKYCSNNYNYLKLFISIIISINFEYFKIPNRCSFIYKYLKIYLIFYHNKSQNSSSFSSLSPYSFSNENNNIQI